MGGGIINSFTSLYVISFGIDLVGVKSNFWFLLSKPVVISFWFTARHIQRVTFIDHSLCLLVVKGRSRRIHFGRAVCEWQKQGLHPFVGPNFWNIRALFVERKAAG